jgi:serine/threonine protein kinase
MTAINVTHCMPHPHIGETLTVNYLRHQLSSGVLLVNYHLPDVTGTQEIDVVVLNYNGVYLLEVKHWIGPIEGDQVHWRHASGDLRRSPIPIIEQKAKIAHGFLAQRGWGDVSVTGLVVLSKGAGALQLDDPQKHKVFGLHESLVEALTGRDYVFHPRSRTLSGSEVQRLRQALLDSHVTDAERRVAGYRVLEERERSHYVELIAEDPEFAGRKVRIKQYDVPAIGSQRELEEAVARFKRDMAALVAAGPHPNLVMPYRFQRDESSDERYYLVLAWTGERTLAERLSEGPIPLDEQLRILTDVATALMHCHQHGIVHRNLTPHSIYVPGDKLARVSDFDFARVPAIGKTISKTGQALVENKYIAPEQLDNPRQADFRADLYSLGAIWYDMLLQRPENEPVRLALMAKSDLSDDIRGLLGSLLAPYPDDRPASTGEVKEWFEILKA